MTTAVDVIVDRQDDIATSRAIHRLAADEPTLLAISIAPDSQSAPTVIWAILRALGKRTEKLAGKTPQWHNAETWLNAHLITELVALRAQHLKPATAHDLTQLAERTGIKMTFVYSGSGKLTCAATITLTEFLTTPRAAHRAEVRTRRWPSIPRSHPMRLRHDCARELLADDFRRVDTLLFATYETLERWLLAHPQATRKQLCQAIRVMRAAHDPNQRHIRESAIRVALHSVGIVISRRRASPFSPRPVSDSQIDEVIAYISAPSAGYTLAELLTGLRPDLLQLIGGDQVTDDSIIGCRVPERARPLLRALSRFSGPVLSPTAKLPCARPVLTRDHADEPPAQAAGDAEAAAGLGQLMRGRRQFITAAEMPAPVRARLEELRATHILDLEGGAYRASHIALYSSYQLPAPPTRALTNEWADPLRTENRPAKQPGRTTAINQDFQ